MSNLIILFLIILPFMKAEDSVSSPINQEMVDIIKMKAETWIPYEVDENPLSLLSNE